jgi:hypothetical protein
MITLTREEIASVMFWFQVAEKEVTLTKAELVLAAKLALIADYPMHYIIQLHQDAKDTTDVELF